MATSTLRGLILVALVVLGIIGLTKLFPQNTSLGVTPAAKATAATSPSGTPSPTASPTGSETRKPRAKSKVTVQVLNGTSRAFFAAVVTDVLKKDGYKTATPGNYSTKISTTIIFYQPNSLPEARRLQRQRFTSAAMKAAPATLASTIDLQVILGQDIAASPAA